MVSAVPGTPQILTTAPTTPVQPIPSPPSSTPSAPAPIPYRLPEAAPVQDKAVYGPTLTQPSAQTNLSFVDEFDVPDYSANQPKGESLGRRLGLTHDLDIQGMENATLKFAPFKVKLRAEF